MRSNTIDTRWSSSTSPHWPETPLPTATLREIERAAVLEALRSSGWNQSRAARRLGVPRHILLYRMKKFDIRSEM
jgi:transcriptional regulator with GAF, ATPase, and Fis domain